jgi:hypothetical protein
MVAGLGGGVCPCIPSLGVALLAPPSDRDRREGRIASGAPAAAI